MNRLQQNHINWLSILRGLNIILVIMFHVRLLNFTTGSTYDFCFSLPSIFTPLRMPLFIFISGGLLFLTRIRKKWSILDLYIDKTKRILLPFIFCVCLYFLIKIIFNGIVKTPVDASFSNFLKSFVIYSGMPSAHLWFLASLFTLMLLYPIFQYVCNSNLKLLIFFFFCILFYFFPLENYACDYFNISQINKNLLWFFVGIIFFKYEIYKYAQNYFILFLSLIFYSLCFILNLQILASICGIVASISLCQKIALSFPLLFSSFRNYIFPIYLFSLIFQAFVERVLWIHCFHNDKYVSLFYILNILFGIYGPVLLSKIAEKIKYQYVKYCMGLDK